MGMILLLFMDVIVFYVFRPEAQDIPPSEGEDH